MILDRKAERAPLAAVMRCTPHNLSGFSHLQDVITPPNAPVAHARGVLPILGAPRPDFRTALCA